MKLSSFFCLLNIRLLIKTKWVLLCVIFPEMKALQSWNTLKIATYMQSNWKHLVFKNKNKHFSCMPIFMTVKNIHYTLMISHNVHNPRAQSSTRAQHEIHRLKARALTICTQKHKTYNPQKMQDYNYVEFSSDWKI